MIQSGVNIILAIVVSDWGNASESFIYDHVVNIAPGRTVVINLSERVRKVSCPVPILDIQMPEPLPSSRSKIIDRIRRQITVYRQFRINGPDKERVQNFFDDYDVRTIMAEYGPNGTAIAPIARQNNIPFSVFFHGWDINILGTMPQWRFRYRTIYRHAKKLFVPVEFAKGRLIGIGAPAEKISTVPCAIALERINPVDHSVGKEINVLMLSRLIDQKGPLKSVETFVRAAERRPSMRLHIVGDGPMMQDVKNMVAASGMGEKITIHGAVPHEKALAILSKCQIFLQHCLSIPRRGIESQAVSMLEAMGAGCVVIVTRHGGMAEQVADQITGFLVDEFDVEMMAKILGAVADNEELRDKVGKSARKFVKENYAPDIILARIRTLLGVDVER